MRRITALIALVFCLSTAHAYLIMPDFASRNENRKPNGTVNSGISVNDTVQVYDAAKIADISISNYIGPGIVTGEIKISNGSIYLVVRLIGKNIEFSTDNYNDGKRLVFMSR